MPRTSGLCWARQEVKTFHRCFNLHRYLQCITDKVCKCHHFYSPDTKTTPQNSAAMLSGRTRNRAFISHFLGLKTTLWITLPAWCCGASSSTKPCSRGALGGAGPCMLGWGMLQTPPNWTTPYTALTAIGSQASLEATLSSDAEHQHHNNTQDHMNLVLNDGSWSLVISIKDKTIVITAAKAGVPLEQVPTPLPASQPTPNSEQDHSRLLCSLPAHIQVGRAEELTPQQNSSKKITIFPHSKCLGEAKSQCKLFKSVSIPWSTITTIPI